MFFLRRPTPRQLDALLADQRDRPHTYRAVGATRDATPPAHHAVDHHRVRLGAGAADFARARAAIDAWQPFALGWCAVYPGDAPVRAGTIVAAVVHHLGFWSANPSRLVYTLDDEVAGVRRYGFAYGTLPAHGEIGEERFSVEWHQADDAVWYDLYAFSRPGHRLARLGAPIVRRLQGRFARDSMRAMQAAVADARGPAARA